MNQKISAKRGENLRKLDFNKLGCCARKITYLT